MGANRDYGPRALQFLSPLASLSPCRAAEQFLGPAQRDLRRVSVRSGLRRSALRAARVLDSVR